MDCKQDSGFYYIRKSSMITSDKMDKRRMRVPLQFSEFKLDPLSAQNSNSGSPNITETNWKSNRQSPSPSIEKHSLPVNSPAVGIALKPLESGSDVSLPISLDEYAIKAKIEIDNKRTEKLLKRRLQDVKNNADKNIYILDNVLRKFSSKDCRVSGVGSVGGHIAREQKAPGPHNGHHPPSRDHLFLATSLAVAKLPKVRLHSREAKIQPDWDSRFIEGRVLSREVRLSKLGSKVADVLDESESRPSTTGKISKVSQFRKEITNFRESNRKYAAISASNDSFLSREQTPKSRPSTSLNKQFRLVPSPPLSPQYFDMRTQREEKSAAPLNLPLYLREKIPLITIAQQLWDTLTVELRASGEDISTSDLSEVHQYILPPKHAVVIMGFICTLVGADPTWSSAKSVLLAECKMLRNYLTEVGTSTFHFMNVMLRFF